MIIINIKGGIGNQFFQYAFGCALEENGRTVKYYLQSYSNGYHHPFRLNCFNTNIKIASSDEIEKITAGSGGFNTNYSLFSGQRAFHKRIIRKVFTLYNNKRYIHYPIIKEKSFYDRRLLSCDNKFFDGYWAKREYFEHIINKLKEDYMLLDKYVNDNFKRVKNKILSSDIPYVAIHIRRGDYLWESNQKIFYNLQKEYYTKSLKFINEKIGNTNFLFFSNDIVWCKENFGDEFEYIDERYGFQDYHEFELMKLCHHNIIANSTFSWWAAYLNDNVNKIVIAPEQWYANKSAQRRHEKNDFIPENWIKL